MERIVCDHCHKRGHVEAVCWDKHPEMRPRRPNVGRGSRRPEAASIGMECGEGTAGQDRDEVEEPEPEELTPEELLELADIYAPAFMARDIPTKEMDDESPARVAFEEGTRKTKNRQDSSWLPPEKEFPENQLPQQATYRI